MKVYEALASYFGEEGVDTVFGLLGDANMFWMTAMADVAGAQLIHARHENAAVAMADGYARTTGRVGVASVTCGPGFTQIPTSLTASVRNSTPLVIFAGDTPTSATFHLQQFDQAPLVAACEAHFVPVKGLDQIADQVQRAFYLAISDRKPVVLSVPVDLQEQELDSIPKYHGSRELLPEKQAIAPDKDMIKKVADLLKSSSRTVLIAGTGAMSSGARDAMIELAERTGALLATSLKAKGLFAGHPQSAGLSGGFATSAARKLFAEADCVIGVGARMGYYTMRAMGSAELFPRATKVQIDTHPVGHVDGMRVADHLLLGDARLAVEAIVSVLSSTDYRSSGYHTDENWELLLAPEIDDYVVEIEPTTMDPRIAFAELDDSLSGDWRIVVGVGHFWNFAVPGLTARRPRSHEYTYAFGAVGQGLATAIGTSFGEDRPVALVEGDGSLIMNIQELETLSRINKPILICVINDGGYGAEIHKFESKGVRGDEALFGRPDLAGIARAFGLNGETVDARGQLGPAIRRFAESPRPTLIDIRVSDRVLSQRYRRQFFGMP